MWCVFFKSHTMHTFVFFFNIFLCCSGTRLCFLGNIHHTAGCVKTTPVGCWSDTEVWNWLADALVAPPQTLWEWNSVKYLKSFIQLSHFPCRACLAAVSLHGALCREGFNLDFPATSGGGPQSFSRCRTEQICLFPTGTGASEARSQPGHCPVVAWSALLGRQRCSFKGDDERLAVQWFSYKCMCALQRACKAMFSNWAEQGEWADSLCIICIHMGVWIWQNSILTQTLLFSQS